MNATPAKETDDLTSALVVDWVRDECAKAAIAMRIDKLELVVCSHGQPFMASVGAIVSTGQTASDAFATLSKRMPTAQQKADSLRAEAKRLRESSDAKLAEANLLSPEATEKGKSP